MSKREQNFVRRKLTGAATAALAAALLAASVCTAHGYTGSAKSAEEEKIIEVQAEADGTPSRATMTVTETESGGEEVEHEENVGTEGLPFAVRLHYELDGKEIRPEELAGKSGHVKITVSYENRLVMNRYGQLAGTGSSAAWGTDPVPVPMMFLTGMLLPEETFRNVEAEETVKLTSLGDNILVYAMCIPGVNSYLDLTRAAKTDKQRDTAEDLEKLLRDSFSIEADVTEFRLDFTATIVRGGLLEDLEDEDLDDLEKLIHKLDDIADQKTDLTDSVNELKDALSSLNSGALTLATNGTALSEGAAGAAQGAQELSAGLSGLTLQLQMINPADYGEHAAEIVMLQQQLAALSGGAEQLSSGISQLSDGVSAYTAGVSRLSEGVRKMNDGVQDIDVSSFGSKVDKDNSIEEGAIDMNEPDSDESDKEEKDDEVSLDDIDTAELLALSARIRKLKEADSRYGSFPDLPEASGDVSFLLETDAIRP